MQILQRKYPAQLARPGQPEKREHEYIRHGMRRTGLLCRADGPRALDLWPDRTSDDFAAHLRAVFAQLPAMARYNSILDDLITH